MYCYTLLISKGLAKIIQQQILSDIYINYILLLPFGDPAEPLDEGRYQKRQHMVLQSVFKKLKKG